MQLILGTLIVIGTIYCIIKKYETRAVLFISGLLMFIVALDPMGAFTAFTEAMKNSNMFIPITTIMGYASVMAVTKSNDHLIHLLTRYLSKMSYVFLIPAVVFITFIINISITSMAGLAAALSIILIPLLVSVGIHPAISAAAVALGTWGSMMNPGQSTNVLTAEVSGLTAAQVVSNHLASNIVSTIVAAIVLVIVAILLKEHKGHEDKLPIETQEAEVNAADFDVNIAKAILPLLPLIIIVISVFFLEDGATLGVGESVLISLLIATLITRHDIGEVSTEFFKGLGSSYGSIFGIIVAASVFTAGLSAVGIVDALIELLINNPEVARISSAVGPYFLAVITGSGNAATIAFNQSITVHASTFGIIPQNMGSVAAIAAAIGRAASPLAGGIIILAKAAKVDPFEVAKRTFVPTVLATVTVLLMLLYF